MFWCLACGKWVHEGPVEHYAFDCSVGPRPIYQNSFPEWIHPDGTRTANPHYTGDAATATACQCRQTPR